MYYDYTYSTNPYHIWAHGSKNGHACFHKQELTIIFRFHLKINWHEVKLLNKDINNILRIETTDVELSNNYKKKGRVRRASFSLLCFNLFFCRVNDKPVSK
ncbi:hypothetical protein PHAVU_004G089400 [Phaseolus vulgaris]|uniref:Uncharacterized protein n=1 Tax=Phaseolus vulgaris TaxID=3885 RepID=V7C3S5_PHAVU|nr:hypothetical protein PHAVU_004G089400g [Phaseolus vulgaris]ESW23940.1 hypothetical protein PHAVU_004G089400g [Phaseolus vulgaris]